MNGALSVVQCWHCRRFFDDAQGWLDHSCPIAASHPRGNGEVGPAPGLPTFASP